MEEANVWNNVLTIILCRKINPYICLVLNLTKPTTVSFFPRPHYKSLKAQLLARTKIYQQLNISLHRSTSTSTLLAAQKLIAPPAPLTHHRPCYSRLRPFRSLTGSRAAKNTQSLQNISCLKNLTHFVCERKLLLRFAICTPTIIRECEGGHGG